ncbi:UNVERIFIED_CONTAM: Cinnamoyl-CoA reductase 2 [Sesamum radiatum]|uniref:Cinnamoyl-CoA reductase 2 n=1 Tax=Sesamum radiatum TaxID=300843 RepID=A0AAW2S7H1_SESRA
MLQLLHQNLQQARQYMAPQVNLNQMDLKLKEGFSLYLLQPHSHVSIASHLLPLAEAGQKRWYWVAKTLAEKAAWEYAQENGINLVILHPGFVIGPLLQPTLNTSSQLILNVLSGSQDFRDYQFVDVRDVASAHILAFENPSATGRYILVGTSITHSHLQHILHELYPSLNLPTIGERNPTFQVSKKKAESLGIKFMPLEVSLKDTVESLMQKNFFKLPK